MTKSELALQTVHTLYIMQIQLIDLLEKSDLSDPTARKIARQQTKEFQDLLERADRRFMGGEDVWSALQQLPLEISQKLKESPVSVAGARKIGRRK